MNIQETLQVLAAQKRDSKSKCVLISKKNLVNALNASADEARDLSSRVFCLIDVPLNRLACPGLSSNKEKVQQIMASGRLQPIVVDLNVKNIGTRVYTPKVVVVVGKESFDAAVTAGMTSTQIWASKQAAEILGCSCSDMSASVYTAKDGGQVHINKILADYKAACKDGYKPKMDAKSAPGWEDSVKRMKSHPDIDNPWALSHWMSDQGYTPGGSDKKKK